MCSGYNPKFLITDCNLDEIGEGIARNNKFTSFVMYLNSN